MIKKFYFLFFVIFLGLCFGIKNIFAYQIDPSTTGASCIILTTTQYTTQAEQLAAFEESMSSPIGTPIQTAIYFINDPTVSGWLNAYGGTNEPPLANPDALNSFNPSGGGDFFSNGSGTPGWSQISSSYKSKLAQQILSFILDLADAPGYTQTGTPSGFVSAPDMQYIILLGNTSNIPASDYEFIQTTSETGYTSEIWYPTDLIYACAGRSGLTGIVPHYAISRILINNTTEASTIIAKIQSWYSNANSSSSWSWFQNVAFAGGGQDSVYAGSSQQINSEAEPFRPTPRIYYGEMDALNIINAVDSTSEGGDNKSYLSGMNVTKYFLTNPQNGGKYFTSTDVNTLLSSPNTNTGNGFVYLIGNGYVNDFYFDDGSSVTSSNFAGYSSSNNIPIILSTGDDNTDFDTILNNNISGNFIGKSALLSPGGAIAFIGPDWQTPGTFGAFYFTNGILHQEQIDFPQLMEEFAKYYHRTGSTSSNPSISNLGTIYASALDDFYNTNSQTWNTNDYITMVECEFIGDCALYIPSQQISSASITTPPQIQPVNPGNPTSSSALKYNSLDIPVYAIPGGSNVNTNPFNINSTITDTSVSSVTTDFIDTRYGVNDPNPGEQDFPFSNGTITYTVKFGSTDTGPGSNGPGLYFIRVSNDSISTSHIHKEVRMYIDVDNQFTPSKDLLVILNDQYRWADQYPVLDSFTGGSNNPTSTQYEANNLNYVNPSNEDVYYNSRLWYINAINALTGGLADYKNNYALWNVVNLYDGQNPPQNPGTDKYGGITWDALKNYIGTDPTTGLQKFVIWVTGANNNDTFSPNDQTAVDSFLSQGGRLFVTGENIGYDIGSSGFYTNTLMANYAQEDIALYKINGIVTNPLSVALNDIDITGGDGAQDSTNPSITFNWPEEINPQSDSSSLCFLYTQGSSSGPGNPVSSDGAGLDYYNSKTGGALVYLPFDFARINNLSGTSNGRVAVLTAILNWLSTPTVTNVFTATPGNALVNLNWSPLPSGQTGILIIRNTGGYDSTQPTNGTTYNSGNSIGTGTVIYVDGTSTTNWTDTGLTNGTTYYYTAYTYNSSNTYSLYGNAYATPTTSSSSGFPAPTNLDATAVQTLSTSSGWEVNLTWQYTGTSETGFQIQRSVLVNGTYTDTTDFQVGTGITSYTDTSVSANTTYAYQIEAINTNVSPTQYSSWSNTALTTTAILQAPVGLNAIAGQNEITLQWTNASNPLSATGFYIQRAHPTPAAPNPPFVTIATLPPTDNTFVDSGDAPLSTGNYLGSGYFCDGKPYYYQVVAFNQTNTETSNEAEATPSALPSGQNPTNLQFLPGVNGFTVDWNDNTTTETAYYIEIWNTIPSDITNPDSVIVLPGTTTTGPMSKSVSVFSGTTWYARVIAQNSSTTGHPGFSLYATGPNGQDYNGGNIFSNSPTTTSGGGGTPVEPLAILLTALLILIKLIFDGNIIIKRSNFYGKQKK